MKTINHISEVIALFIVTILGMTGCIEELEGRYGECSEICFTADMESSDDTKAVPINKLEGTAGVIGYINSAQAQNTFSLWERLDNVTYEFDGDQMSAQASPVGWNSIPAGADKLRIYSFTPENILTGTEPVINHTVPADVTKQTDIITAYAEIDRDDFEKVVPLTFSHALTAVKFRSGFESDINVLSISVKGVCNQGSHTIGNEEWDGCVQKLETGKTQTEFTISFGASGKLVKKGQMITSDEDGNVLMMIPQIFASDSEATISMTYKESATPLTFSLKGLKWEKGDMITYTLNQKGNSEYIYFDLAAGNVKISDSSYEGYIFVNGVKTRVVDKNNEHKHTASNKYYVYQSNPNNDSYYGGYRTEADYLNGQNFIIPKYDLVTLEDGTLWSDFITNNTNVEKVIETWDDGKNIRADKSSAANEGHIGTAVVRKVGRTHTLNYISITGKNTPYDLTVDNIYSVIQESESRSRSAAGISYVPSGGTTLTVNFVGDNRMGCLHINNKSTDKIHLEGTGSLTVADTDFLVKKGPGSNDYYGDVNNYGYVSNLQNSAIGNNTYDGCENVYNLYINSGVIFAGTTKTENCTAIGGGGNGSGQIFITGGVVTAVATSAGTAIGGGMGHDSHGGAGYVTISGGNVYAYNFANRWGISSAAIGGGGSRKSAGSNGEVEITGGSVYSYSELGTAIGGGSSSLIYGGNAKIAISGGYIIAKSNNKISNGIGGGTGGTNAGAYGGSAEVTISGDPIIRTGSIGGGKTNNKTGNIGSAKIDISGGDIQAQFVMAAGAGTPPTFTMTGGEIRNSNTDNNKDKEYFNVETNGGAVYLDAGNFTMRGGTISGCLAEYGGAVYIKGGSFSMTGGQITECTSKYDGGAVYLEGGSVTISGGEVSYNLAQSGNGGGFCIYGGDFNMVKSGTTPARIQSNAAFGGSGGGIFVTSTDNVTVNLEYGKIESNSSDKFGGGICVDMEYLQTGSGEAVNGRADVTVGTPGNGPSIMYNHTGLQGGGLYARGQNAYITINGGSINENKVSGYEANPNVANVKGRVTLNSDDVTTSVIVTYNNNYAYYDEPAGVIEVEQKIVTATNSIMVAPENFNKRGYHLVGWNTRPDGKGTAYTNGQVMNLSEDLTLYAQWILN